MRFRVVVLAALVWGCASSLQAQPIAIVNAGFEANVITPGAFVVLDPTGWNRYDPSGIINQNANSVGVIRPLPGVEYFPGGTPEGVNAALVFLANNAGTEAGLQQTLTSSLVGNTRYTLSVQIGNIASGTSLPGSSDGGGVFYDLDGFPGYRIDLMAGGVVIASDNNSIGNLIPEGEFRLSTLIFNTPINHPQIGQNLGIRLVNLNQPGTPQAPNIEVDFDDVRLVATAVPEPATWLLIGLTMAVAIPLMGRQRRKLAANSPIAD
jgi:hapalindole H/12-epi-hapalindole U/12-epi-fischerindole U synthase